MKDQPKWELGKGKEKNQKGSKGKEDTEGKGNYKEWQKKQSEDAESSYTNRTAYGENWGLAKDNQKWERDNYYDDWIQVKGQWRKNYNRKGRKGCEEESTLSVSPPTTWIGREEMSDQEPRRNETSLLGFGKYHDWAYGEILANKPNYATYICQESFESSEEQQSFQEWVTLKTFGSEKEAMEERKGQNQKKQTKG